MVASHVRFTTLEGIVVVLPTALMGLACLNNGGLYKVAVVGVDREHTISQATFDKLCEIIEPFVCRPPEEDGA